MAIVGIISCSFVSFTELLVLILHCCIVVVVCLCVSEPNLAASPSACSTVRRSNWFRQCERTDTQTPSVLLPSLPHSLTRTSTFSPTKEEEKHPPSLSLLLHHSLAPINLHGTEMQNTRAWSFSQLFSFEDIGSVLNELTEPDSEKRCICNSCFSLKVHILWVTEMGPRSINGVQTRLQ